MADNDLFLTPPLFGGKSPRKRSSDEITPVAKRRKGTSKLYFDEDVLADIKKCIEMNDTAQMLAKQSAKRSPALRNKMFETMTLLNKAIGKTLLIVAKHCKQK